MPQLPPETLDCVCYLYQSEEDAKAGSNFGGTAFLVAMSASVDSRAYIYAVTNWHVAVRDRASVLRVNTRDGKGDIFAVDPEQWEFDPRFDIAVMPIRLDSNKHKFKAIHLNGFVTKDQVKKQKLGPGEDVFMVGRFVDHDGGPVNQPAVRFGHISVMPTAMEQPNTAFAEAYCIDMHSRSGYSGSPVFVYRTPGSDLSERLSNEIKEATILLAGVNYLGLLGIHFAQFPEEWELKMEMLKSPPWWRRISSLWRRETTARSESFKVPAIKDGAYVKGLSGMTCVLPAWCIAEVLNLPQLVARRNASNARLEKQLREQGAMPPQSESA
jgi:hypothetical protein